MIGQNVGLVRGILPVRYLAAAGLAVMISGMLATAEARASIDDFPQKDDSWSESVPTIISRGDIGEYPVLAELLQITGSVTILFWIDTKGAVKRPLIKTSQPNGMFEASCLDFVRSFIYAPQYKVGSDRIRLRRWSYTCKYELR